MRIRLKRATGTVGVLMSNVGPDWDLSRRRRFPLRTSILFRNENGDDLTLRKCRLPFVTELRFGVGGVFE